MLSSAPKTGIGVVCWFHAIRRAHGGPGRRDVCRENRGSGTAEIFLRPAPPGILHALGAAGAPFPLRPWKTGELEFQVGMPPTLP